MMPQKTRFNQTARVKLANSIGFYISIVTSYNLNKKPLQDNIKTQEETLKRGKTDLKEATMTNW